MDETKLEAGYEAAKAEFEAKAERGANEARYFFWAGATFGTQLAQEIYNESFSPRSLLEDERR